MSDFVNRCKFYAASTGTGNFVAESAVQGYRLPDDSDAVNTNIYSYVAETIDGLEWEIGTGVYTTSDNTIVRNVLSSSNSDALVNFSTPPVVAFTVLAEDLKTISFPATFNNTVIFNDSVTANDTFSFTVPAEFADGTAALPSITFINDTDTGIYRSAANELSATTGGTQRFSLSSSGLTLYVSEVIDGGIITTGRYGNSGALVMRRAEGTITSPTVVTGTTTVGNFLARAYDGTAYRDVAGITFESTASPVLSTSSPGEIVFRTTPSGSTSTNERLRISSAGLTSVTGTFSVSSTSAFTGNVTVGPTVIGASAGSIELGTGGTGDRVAFIDFHASGTPGAIDYSTRVIRNPGTNGVFSLVNTGSGGILLSPGAGGLNVDQAANFDSYILVNGGAVYVDGVPNSYLIFRNSGGTEKAELNWNAGSDTLYLGRTGLTNSLNQNSSNVWKIGTNNVWHAGLVIDEDTMASNLDTKVPTQQSVKAYVDSKDTIGKQEIWIPAIGMVARVTNGAAPFSTELATNDVMINGYDFDTSTVEGVGFFIALPKQWNEGTVTFKGYWTAASGSGTVAWSLQGAARSDDDAMDQAYGTAQTSTDTLITANDVHESPESSAITITGTPAAEDLCFFLLTRATGSDTLGVDARLLGIKLYITTDAGTDD